MGKSVKGKRILAKERYIKNRLREGKVEASEIGVETSVG